MWAQLVSFDDEGALLELLKLFAEGFNNSICWKSERAGDKKNADHMMNKHGDYMNL